MALFSLSTARALGLKYLILEGDSLEVINLLANSDGDVPWSICSLIHNCLLLSRSFSLFSLSHVKRCANSMMDC